MKKSSWGLIKKQHLPFFIGVPAMLWQALFFYVPLAVIVYSSIMALSDDFLSFTLERYSVFFKLAYFKALGYSFVLATLTTFLCFLIGYSLAYFLAFSHKRYRDLLLLLLMIPFLTNFLLHVYAWFYVLEINGFLNQFLQFFNLVDKPTHCLNSLFSIMIMMIYYYTPFMTLPIYAALERFDKTLIEASLDLGASKLQTLKNITLPLTAQGITAGFFLVFIPAFGEFVIPELMGGDKLLFAGNVISLYILEEKTGSLGAAFTVIAIITIIISSLSFYKLINYLLKPRSLCPKKEN